MILLDTCALIWHTTAPEMMSPKALKALDSAGNLVISSISIWEVGVKVKNKKMVLPIPFEAYVDRVKQIEGIRIVPVDENLWVDSVGLRWDHRDPADRVIVATAMRLAIPIVTVDNEIKSFYKKVIW